MYIFRDKFFIQDMTEQGEGVLGDSFDVVGGDGDHGGAKDVEGDNEEGGAGLMGNGAFKSSKLTSCHTDVVA